MRSLLPESTAFGVAIAAAQAEGINLWHFNDKQLSNLFSSRVSDTFLPVTTEEGNWHSLHDSDHMQTFGHISE